MLPALRMGIVSLDFVVVTEARREWFPSSVFLSLQKYDPKSNSLLLDNMTWRTHTSRGGTKFVGLPAKASSRLREGDELDPFLSCVNMGDGLRDDVDDGGDSFGETDIPFVDQFSKKKQKKGTSEC